MWTVARKEEREWLQKYRLNWFKEGGFNEVKTIPLKKFDIPLKRINPASKRLIESPFSEEEVLHTIQSFDSSSAPDFRPISLVDSMYKIVSRLLAKRLVSCLSEVIGEHQFAFMAGKQIANSSLITNEVIDGLSKRKKATILIKADFYKAFDAVDWQFLNLILKKIGFGKRWRNWVNLCISTPSIAILINGSPTNSFSMKKGLRQGCSLSLLLFNIVGEVLNEMLQKASDIRLCRGVEVGSGGLVLSHIQFADDLIIFLDSNNESIANFFRILKIFEVAAGLKLYMTKTLLMGVNLDYSCVKSRAYLFHCGCAKLPSSYLGLSLGDQKISKLLWKPILDKVSMRLQSWKGKLLSLGGRLTLIKTVLANLPVYLMSIFPMPKAIADQINSRIVNFIWNSNSERSIHWIKWDTICKPKSHGGLDFFDVNIRNRSLLNKWIWRYSVENDSLWRKIVVAKYNYDHDAILPKTVKYKSSSWVWRSIENPSGSFVSDFLGDLRLVMDNGHNIDFWTEKISLKSSFPRIFSLVVNKCEKIKEFGCWVLVLNRAVSAEHGRDRVFWSGALDGIYTPKAVCCKVLCEGLLEDPVWKSVWCNLVPPKVAAFVWKAVRLRLSVMVKLAKRGVDCSDQWCQTSFAIRQLSFIVSGNGLSCCSVSSAVSS
ncbi:hypothetical protein F3Y22_tig00112523pilonHSYRG00172 [Hibiscus syriacus]|uniref:Reverse transcriptase domain-containing protein n=1 Tax=Hibiscus syriacus TaxID=106335 RepID=A0A6A2WW32_HIBSY|nr:hypothetical protein F3Y22_tig00112523pilonHSYRG00172 [Hibiscus syriacus]